MLAGSQVAMASEESEEFHPDVGCYWIVDQLDRAKGFWLEIVNLLLMPR